jgi:flagella basal body P-ring formation protein FlgA
LEADELCELLVAAMGRRGAGGLAEWELHLTRPWAPLVVTDEPLKAEIIEPTPERMGPASILRFELRQSGRLLGSWQMPVQAKLWREVLVARSNLQRGSPLVEASLDRERRDVLALREPMTELPSNADACELDETVSAGSPLLGRAIKTRPVVFRGQMADAVVKDGAMVISLKVEVMEEGIPGQVVRVRNPQSRRELRGKVQDERTIVIPL